MFASGFAWVLLRISLGFLQQNIPIPDVLYGNWLLIKWRNYAIILLLKKCYCLGIDGMYNIPVAIAKHHE